MGREQQRWTENFGRMSLGQKGKVTSSRSTDHVGHGPVVRVLTHGPQIELSTVLRKSRDRVCPNKTGHLKDLSLKEGQGPL